MRGVTVQELRTKKWAGRSVIMARRRFMAWRAVGMDTMLPGDLEAAITFSKCRAVQAICWRVGGSLPVGFVMGMCQAMVWLLDL